MKEGGVFDLRTVHDRNCHRKYRQKDQRIPEHETVPGAFRQLHATKYHGNDQHAVRGELDRSNGIFRMYHSRYKQNTGSYG